jgi:O-acetyl-ADP-ribose deacetylase
MSSVQHSHGFAARSTETAQLTSVRFQKQNVEIEVLAKHAEFQNTGAECIVSTADRQLYVYSGLSKAITDEAGPSFEKECRKAMAARNHRVLDFGEGVITSAGFLSRNGILDVVHILVPDWCPSRNSSSSHAKTQMILSVVTALQLTEKNRRRSIAFALMGTGMLGWPEAEAAAVIVEGIKSWIDTERHIDNIRTICLFDREHARAVHFKNAIEAAQPRASADVSVQRLSLADQARTARFTPSPHRARWYPAFPVTFLRRISAGTKFLSLIQSSSRSLSL